MFPQSLGCRPLGNSSPAAKSRSKRLHEIVLNACTAGPHLEVVILLDSLAEFSEILGCKFARAQNFILLVHPELDVIGGVHKPVTLQDLAKPLCLVLLVLWRAEGQVVVLICLAACRPPFSSVQDFLRFLALKVPRTFCEGGARAVVAHLGLLKGPTLLAKSRI